MTSNNKNNKIKQKTFPMPFQDLNAVFSVIPSMQNWHANYNVA